MSARMRAPLLVIALALLLLAAAPAALSAPYGQFAPEAFTAPTISASTNGDGWVISITEGECKSNGGTWLYWYIRVNFHGTWYAAESVQDAAGTQYATLPFESYSTYAGSDIRVRCWNPATNTFVATSNTITLSAIPTRLTAPTPTVGSVTISGASVSWTAVSNASAYELRYKKKSGVTWTTVTGVTSPRSVTGLDASTAYQVQLRATVTTGYWNSAWSSSVEFTTLSNALSAPTPSVGSITATGASVSWTAVTNADSYNIRYKKQSDSTWSESTGVTSPRSVTSLDSGTAYEVQLKAVAGAGYTDSAWSSSTDFTTLSPLSAPTPSVGSITTTGASVSWTAVSNADSYNLRYKKQSDNSWTTSTGVTSPRTLSGLDSGTAYETQLKAVGGSGYADSGWSSSADFTTLNTALSAPTPVVGSITGTGASVSWTAVANASTYDMRYKKQSDTDWTTTSGVTSPRTLSGLTVNTPYEAQLRSMASGYEDGAWSTSTNFTTVNISAPGAPGSINVAAGNASTFLYWTPPASGDAPTRYEYQWRKDGIAWSSWTSTGNTDTKKTFTTLDNDVEYRYKVRACNSGGCSAQVPAGAPYYVAATPASNKTLPTAPGAPTGLTAAAGVEQVTLSWTAPASNGGLSVTGYDVGRITSSYDSGETLITGSGGGTVVNKAANAAAAFQNDLSGSAFSRVSLSFGGNAFVLQGDAATLRWDLPKWYVNGRTFTIRYKDSAPSSVADGTQISGTATGGWDSYSTTIHGDMIANVTLSNQPDGRYYFFVPVSDQSAYQISGWDSKVRAQVTTFTSWKSTGSSNASHTVTGLTGGTAYTFKARAVNPVGGGTASGSVSATPLREALSAPTPSVGSITGSSASVSWTAVPNASTYDMRHKKQADSGWVVTTGVTSPRALSILDANAAYEVQLRSLAAGYQDGAWSPSANFTTSDIPPDAPTEFTATPGNEQVILRWTAPADNNGSAITRYEYQQDGGSWISTGGTDTAFTKTSLTNGTSYGFKVRAVNGIGAGTGTAQVSAVPRTVPGAPTSLAVQGGSDSAALTWAAPSNDGGAAVTGYEYQQDGGDWTATGSPGLSYTVTGLTTGHSYAFRVRAVNPAGASLPSNEVHVIPGALEIVIGAGTGADAGRYGYSQPGGYGTVNGELPGILFSDNQPRTVSSIFEGESGGNPYWLLAYSSGADGAFKNAESLGAVMMQASYANGVDNRDFVIGGFVDADNSTGRMLTLRPPLPSADWSGRSGQKVSLIFGVNAPPASAPAAPDAGGGLVAPTPVPGADPIGQEGEFTRFFLDSSMGDVVSQIAITVFATAVLLFTPKIESKTKLNLVIASLVFTPWIPAAFEMGSLFLASLVSVIIGGGWVVNKYILKGRAA